MMEHINGQLQHISWSIPYILPEIVLCCAFLLMILLDVFLKQKARKLIPLLGLGTCILISFLVYRQFFSIESGSLQLFHAFLKLDHFSLIFKLLIALAGLMTILFSLHSDSLQKYLQSSSEFYLLLMVMLLGLFLMTMASHLLFMYLSIELVSICSYVLSSYQVKERNSAEAGMKYVLFGAVSSAFMLFGISWIYGCCGTLDIFSASFLSNLSLVNKGLSTFAILLTLSGFLFKISAVPFHFWTPDVYEGSSWPVAAFFSMAPKVAGFAILMRFLSAFTFKLDDMELIWPTLNWQLLIGCIALASVLLGNLSAIVQNKVKRILAFSSIGHTGFMLMALSVFSLSGQISLVFYIMVYGISSFAVFMLASYYADLFQAEKLSDYTGLGFIKPLAGVLMIIVLASLVGLPPTGGFTAKFLLFSSLWEAYSESKDPLFLTLLLVGILNTLIALFYYFKILLNMYFRKREHINQESKHPQKTILIMLVVMLCIFILYAGLFPSDLVSFLQHKLLAGNHFFFNPSNY